MTLPAEAALVLDVGTGSGRAAVVTRLGEVITVAAREHSLAPDAHGVTELDADATWSGLEDAIRQALGVARARRITIVAVSATSIRGALVLVDRDGRAVWACGSTDARAVVGMRRLAASGSAFHAATGQLPLFAALPRVDWFRTSHRDAWDRVARLLTLDAWLLHRSGGSAAIAVPSAAPTGLLALERGAWIDPATVPDQAPWCPDGELRGLLPPPVPSGVVVGSVDVEVARALGLQAGIPIVAAGGDGQLAALGMGLLDAGDAGVVMGSHWQQLVVRDTPATDPDARFRLIAAPVPGTWHADAIAFGAGLHLDRYIRGLGAADHERMAAAAADLEPGAGGVLAVAGAPIDAPDVLPAAPTLLGLPTDSPATDTAVGYRAIVEAGCLVAGRNLSLMAAAAAEPRSTRGLVAAGSIAAVRVAGGATRSDLVCQVLADVLGRPVQRGSTPQASLVGAAICAGVGAGWYPDVRTGALEVAMTDAARVPARFEPRPWAHEAYRELGGRWMNALRAQQDLVRAGVTRPIVSLPR